MSATLVSAPISRGPCRSGQSRQTLQHCGSYASSLDGGGAFECGRRGARGVSFASEDVCRPRVAAGEPFNADPFGHCRTITPMNCEPRLPPTTPLELTHAVSVQVLPSPSRCDSASAGAHSVRHRSARWIGVAFSVAAFLVVGVVGGLAISECCASLQGATQRLGEMDWSMLLSGPKIRSAPSLGPERVTSTAEHEVGKGADSEGSSGASALRPGAAQERSADSPDPDVPRGERPTSRWRATSDGWRPPDPAELRRCEDVYVYIVTDWVDGGAMATVGIGAASRGYPKRVGARVGKYRVAAIGTSPHGLGPTVWLTAGGQTCAALLFDDNPARANAAAKRRAVRKKAKRKRKRKR